MDVQRTAQRTHRAIGRMIMLVVLCLIGYGVFLLVRDMNVQRPTVTAGRSVFQVDVARTPEEQHRGLGGRPELAEGRGMLFVFAADGRWEMVMRNMHFPIDIIWLDEQKRVVHIEHGVQPDAEPYEVYRPKIPARYVLEVGAGAAKQAGLSVGGRVEFHLEQQR